MREPEYVPVLLLSAWAMKLYRVPWSLTEFGGVKQFPRINEEIEDFARYLSCD
jgi:hypothetical protein